MKERFGGMHDGRNPELVRHGTVRQHSDGELEGRIDRLHATVKAWAERNDLWRDARFEKVVKSFDMKTGAPTVATLRAGDPLAELVIHPGIGAIHDTPETQRLSDECQRLIEGQGFYGEPFSECRLNLIPLEQHSPFVFGQFKEYMRWKWICNLIRGDFDALNAELYEYFSKNADQLTRLHWREFEKLVSELLEAQGFQTELGRGSADGGIDIRLLQRDPIGDILTLVQVKKYRVDRRIELQAVQALHGATTAYSGDHSMFVTTSDYQRCAREFAGRENVGMDLYVSDDVRKWCDDANNGIVENKMRITTESEIARALENARINPRTILHARCGYTMRYNKFCLLLKESNSSGLVMDLPALILQHDGYKQAGTEVPDLADDRRVLQRTSTVRRLKKSAWDTGHRFSDIDEELEFYTTWNQEPSEFYGD